MTEADNLDVKFFESLVDSAFNELDQAEKILWSNEAIRTDLKTEVHQYISKLQELRAIRNRIVNKTSTIIKNQNACQS